MLASTVSLFLIYLFGLWSHKQYSDEALHVLALYSLNMDGLCEAVRKRPCKMTDRTFVIWRLGTWTLAASMMTSSFEHRLALLYHASTLGSSFIWSWFAWWWWAELVRTWG